MLVLTRKTGQRIRIGDNVVVEIVRIGPGSVRIGIEAPKGLNIVREELIEPQEGARMLQINFGHLDGNTYGISYQYRRGEPYGPPVVIGVSTILIAGRIPYAGEVESAAALAASFRARLNNPADGLLDTVLDAILSTGVRR